MNLERFFCRWMHHVALFGLLGISGMVTGEDAALTEAREQRELKTKLGSALLPSSEADAAKSLAKDPFSKLKVSQPSPGQAPIQEGKESEAAEESAPPLAPVVKVSPAKPIEIREPELAEKREGGKENQERLSLFGLRKRNSRTISSDRDDVVADAGGGSVFNDPNGASGRSLSEAPVSGAGDRDVHRMLTPEAALARFGTPEARTNSTTGSEISHESQIASQPSQPKMGKVEVSIPLANPSRSSVEDESQVTNLPEKVDSKLTRSALFGRLLGKDGPRSSATEAVGSLVSDPDSPGPSNGIQVPKRKIVSAAGGASSIGRGMRTRASESSAPIVSQSETDSEVAEQSGPSSTTGEVLAIAEKPDAGKKPGLLKRLFENGDRVSLAKALPTDASQSTALNAEGTPSIAGDNAGGGNRPASDDAPRPVTPTSSDGYVPLAFGPATPGIGNLKPDTDLPGGVELPTQERASADTNLGEPKTGFLKKLMGASSSSETYDSGSSPRAVAEAFPPSVTVVSDQMATDPDSEIDSTTEFNPGDQVAHQSPILVAIGDFGGGRFVGKDGTPSKPLEYAMVIQKLSDGAVWSKVRVPDLGEGFLPSSQLRPASFDETISFIQNQQKP